MRHFASNSHSMRLFRPLLTAVSTAPFFANLSVHGLQFMVYALERNFGNAAFRDTNWLLWPFFVAPPFPLSCVFGADVTANERSISITRFRPSFRKLEKAVAVYGVCSGVLGENSGKVPGRLLEKLSRIAKCYKF